MALEIIGLLIVLSHLAVMGTIILWFGLGKPTSAKQFRLQFRKQFLGVGAETK